MPPDSAAPDAAPAEAPADALGGIRAPAPVGDLSPEAPAKGYVHRLRVGWKDCDPAQIAYTGRLPIFALEALDAWCEDVLGAHWVALNLRHGMGTPFVHLAMDFTAPVRAGWIDCGVAVTRVGRSSLGYRVDGFQEGRHCFTGSFVTAFVNASTFEKIDMPPGIRAAVEALLE